MTAEAATQNSKGTRTRDLPRDRPGRPPYRLGRISLQIRMVAGNGNFFTGKKEHLIAEACNHPNCLVLPFAVELIRLAA
jgi:hypothetical protein